MKASTAALEYEHVTKFYGDTRALNDLSLTIQPGGFLGLLGPNGAGKTTAIHLAAGLAKLRQGQIRVFGHDVIEDYQDARRKIGIAPQESNFDRFFTILDCLIYQGGYFGLPTNTCEERALKLLDRFELFHKKDDRPRQLSGGEKRRLLIAKALIHDPEILILDEPTASLDVKLRHMLWDYLRSLKDQGKTMLLTTHYVEEVEALADRVAILNEGELILCDEIESVMETYGRYSCKFEVNELPENVQRQLNETYPFLEITGSTLHANRRSFDEEISDILDILRSHDLRIEGLHFEETELEEIFLKTVNEDE